MPRLPTATLFALLPLLTGLGCELIAKVDGNKIQDTGSAAATTAAGMGGAGGMGGSGGMTGSAMSSSGGTSASGGATGSGGMGASATSGSGGASASTSGSGGATVSTSGSGGASASTSGVGGDGGVGCNVENCPIPPNECVVRTCSAGVCGTANVAAGVPTSTQTAGDCKRSQCDGNGGIATANDDGDMPNDGNDCTDDVCAGGVPSNPPKAASTACGTNGDLFCNGVGICVGCVSATDCAGQDTECQTRACNSGVCGVLNAPQGKPVISQTAGDCKVNQCDGNGAVAVSDDNSDVPVDHETCTQDLCANGVPSNPPQPVSTVCSEGTGTKCDGAGRCVACLAAGDCPGQDTECQQRSCNAGTCGVTFTALGTAVSIQTPDDCQKVVCDGNGATTSQSDDTDLPDDNNTCTNDVCTAGVPSNPNQADGATCGGSLTCLNGTCSGCGQPSDCPGVDDECKSRTCTVGLCGFAFTASGTAVAAQTAGDCQKQQCDGAGNTVKVADATDLPADDGKQCTGEVCNSGAPSHPAVPVNTACNQGGGSFCSATANCVPCNAASQCPGSDTDCQARSCTANTCGFSFQPAGTVTSTQTPGDCKVNQCDGAGNVVAVTSNGDVPADDGSQCTSEVCNSGVPSHPTVPLNTACNQGGGSFCSAGGSCVACNAATQCSGSDTECQTRTCNAGTCGTNNAAAGTPTSAQTPGDCHQNQCDGSGNITGAADNTDVPADDGNQCTSDLCAGGVPAHPPKPIDTACNQGGGSFCNAAGTCGQCNTAAECPGSDTECQARTCVGNTCGVNNTPAGTPTSAQTPGDCQENTCDGIGNVTSAADDTDLPPDDGIQCTSEVCSGGVPAHPPVPIDTACNQGGGSFCDGTGLCGQCNTAAECPGSDTECQARTCTGNTCGVDNAPAGTPTSAQTAGDCHQNDCDGAGNIIPDVDDTDVPADDGLQCTGEACAAGVASHPVLPPGTACNQMGGDQCDGAGSCVLDLQVASTSPSDATTPAATPTIAVTFTAAMNPATLTGQTTAGACSGSVQVSFDGFASCLAFSSASAVMSGGNTTATFTAAPGLLVNRLYQMRVTTAAQSAGGIALPAQFTQPTGFMTTSPDTCDGSIVISQVYGGGGGASPTYGNDFIELHNRGSVAVSVNGWAVQYTSGPGTGTWTKTALPNVSIQPGAYLLVAEGGGSSGTFLPLPTPDVTGTVAMSATAGKVALTSNGTALTGGCPTGAAIVDLVGYGATASCFEGAASTAAPSSTTSVHRVQSGCADVNSNTADFVTGTPTPQNSASALVGCGCTVENESGAALEAEFCDTQFQLSMTVAAGATSPNVFGQIFESGVTGMGSAIPTIRSQLGFGPKTANPEYEAGWTWKNATFNTSVSAGGNDEYQATLVAPASGSYNYVYRVSLDQGVSWTYCDNSQNDGGAGKNPNLTFSFADEAILTVP